MRTPQLAINSVTTRQAGFEEALAAYAAAGFRQVEFMLSHVKDWLAAGHTVAEARALLDRTGSARSAGSSSPSSASPPESRRANRTRSGRTPAGPRARRRHAGRRHRRPGTAVARRPGGRGGGLRGFVELIDGLDVDVALEFNWGPFVKSLQSAVLVCEQVDHPRLGVLFDPAHYHTTVTKFEHLTAETVALDQARPPRTTWPPSRAS